MSNLLSIIKTLLNEEEDLMKTTPASIEQGGGDPKQYKKEKAKKEPKPAKKKPKHGKRDSLGRSDAGPSSNHPDYLKKKLYQRGVKPKGYGKEGDSTKPLTTDQINRMGVRGQEKKIAKKKKKTNRKAKAQEISNKIRRMRGLPPQLPGEGS